MILAISIIFWAVWRRVFGGWLGLSRGYLVALAFVFAYLQAYEALTNPYIALLAGVLTIAFWTPGHDFRKNSALWKRYGHIGIPWMLMERFEGRRPLGMGWTEVSELGAGALFGLTLEGLLYALPLLYNGL